mgnify:CR=1 FL=1
MPDEKMKYPLLEFEYDKKLYEELLTHFIIGKQRVGLIFLTHQHIFTL